MRCRTEKCIVVFRTTFLNQKEKKRAVRKTLLCKNEVNEQIHVQCSRKQTVSADITLTYFGKSAIHVVTQKWSHASPGGAYSLQAYEQTNTP